MKKFLMILMLVASSQSSFAGELIAIGEKFQNNQGLFFYPVTFKLPAQFLDHCAENKGKGRFDIQYFSDKAVRRYSCSVLLAPLSQMRSFNPSKLIDTFDNFSLPEIDDGNGRMITDPRKNHHLANPLTHGKYSAFSNGVGFSFKKAGFSAIYIDGEKFNFEGFERPVDGHYMGFQAQCEVKGTFSYQNEADTKTIENACPESEMLSIMHEISPTGHTEIEFKMPIPRGHPEFKESPYGF